MGADTLSGAIGNIFYFLGQITFTWIPGTITAVTGTAPGSSPPLSLLSQPVSAPDVLSFLQTAAPAAYPAFFHWWIGFVAVSIVISLLLIALLVYIGLQKAEERRHEKKKFEAAAHPVAAHDLSRTQLRWNRLVEEIESGDEQKWRLALLEADIMLGELLDVLGYRGDTMGDKMKQIDRADFRTIDLAWEAHRVRNEIAHEGSARLLNAREARRVLGLYEQVFREFKVIE